MITKFLKILFVFGTLITIAASCNKDEKEVLPECKNGIEFFPAAVGKYWVYRLDSTVYNQLGNNTVNTVSYIRDEIISESSDASGGTDYTVARSFSRDGVNNWVWVSTNLWNLASSNVIVTEGNLQFFKMGFPITQRQSFTSISLFDENLDVEIGGEPVKVYRDWGKAMVERLDDPCDDSQERFLEIHYADFESLINRRFVSEKYQWGVGLTERMEEIFDTQILNQGMPWSQKAQRGYAMKKTLIEHN